MAILAINTASSLESVALFDKGKLLGEITWKGKRDETAKLLPTISRLLKQTRLTWKKLTRVLVVSGPGPFSALRIGVATANALAFALKLPLYEMSSEVFWRQRVAGGNASQNSILMLHAGGDFVYREGGKLPSGIWKCAEALTLPEHLRKAPLFFYGDLTEDESAIWKTMAKGSAWKFVPEKSLSTFGEVLAEAKQTLWKQTRLVEPRYFRPPNVTKPRVRV